MINCDAWTLTNGRDATGLGSVAKQSPKSRRGQSRGSSKAQSILPNAPAGAQSTTHGKVTELSADRDGAALNASMPQGDANAAPPSEQTVTIETETPQTITLQTSSSYVESAICEKTADSPISPLILPAGIKPYYNHAGIVIIHGDCREILPLLACARADALVTDPPYGIGFAAQPTKWQRIAGMEPQSWDDSPVDVCAFVQQSPVQAIWGGNYYSLPVSRGWLCWYKPDSPPSMGDFELCWTNLDRNAAHITHSIAATNRERVGHPTQKPLAVMLATLSYLGNPPKVIDPYAGSGSTLVAAKELGSCAIGIEIEEKYCEIAAKRLSQEVFQF